MIIFVFFSSSNYVSAHFKGASYFSINGEEVTITNSGHLPIDPAIAQSYYDLDYASHSYSSGQKLNFQFLKDKLWIPTEYIAGSDFIWNFGDGSTQTVKGGLSLSHTYKNPGNYLVTVEANYPPDVENVLRPLPVESVYLVIIEKSQVRVLQQRAFKSDPSTQTSQTTETSAPRTQSTDENAIVASTTTDTSNNPPAKKNSTTQKIAIPGIILAALATGFVVLRKKK